MVIAICAALAAVLAVFLYWQDNGLLATRYTYSSKKIPASFSGFTIAQISDLHNKRFGQNQEKLADCLQAASPDIIVITGDLVDCHRTSLPAAMECISRALQVAPVYYVPGNHEKKSGIYEELAAQLASAGVHVLDNSRTEICRTDEHITILGARDIEFLKKAKKSKPVQEFTDSLSTLCRQAEGFTVLLSHRPEYLDLYAAQPVDLVFSGHAHGGQIRLPGIGGLYAPGQGWHPAYTAGLYQRGSVTLCVSRGLGNSEFPFRVWNRPEIVILTMQKED